MRKDVLFDGSPALASIMPAFIRGSLASVGAVVLAAWLESIGLAYAWWLWVTVTAACLVRLAFGALRIVCTRVLVDGQRIRLSAGILQREVTSLELFRIQNVWSVVRWWQRPFAIGDLLIETSDPRHPFWRLSGLPDPEQLRDVLNEAAVALRISRGVREVNVGQV
nr:PH domain-containing protein [uncultured Ralstonia sp.]